MTSSPKIREKSIFKQLNKNNWYDWEKIVHLIKLNIDDNYEPNIQLLSDTQMKLGYWEKIP